MVSEGDTDDLEELQWCGAMTAFAIVLGAISTALGVLIGGGLWWALS